MTDTHGTQESGRAIPRYDLTDGPTFEVDVYVVDVALPWMREDPWGRPLPDVDWRFHIQLPSGGRVTFADNTTAADVAAYLRREGLEPAGAKR